MSPFYPAIVFSDHDPNPYTQCEGEETIKVTHNEDGTYTTENLGTRPGECGNPAQMPESAAEPTDQPRLPAQEKPIQQLSQQSFDSYAQSVPPAKTVNSDVVQEPQPIVVSTPTPTPDEGTQPVNIAQLQKELEKLRNNYYNYATAMGETRLEACIRKECDTVNFSPGHLICIEIWYNEIIDSKGEKVGYDTGQECQAGQIEQVPERTQVPTAQPEAQKPAAEVKEFVQAVVQNPVVDEKSQDRLLDLYGEAAETYASTRSIEVAAARADAGPVLVEAISIVQDAPSQLLDTLSGGATASIEALQSLGNPISQFVENREQRRATDESAKIESIVKAQEDEYQGVVDSVITTPTQQSKTELAQNLGLFSTATDEEVVGRVNELISDSGVKIEGDLSGFRISEAIKSNQELAALSKEEQKRFIDEQLKRLTGALEAGANFFTDEFYNLFKHEVERGIRNFGRLKELSDLGQQAGLPPLFLRNSEIGQQLAALQELSIGEVEQEAARLRAEHPDGEKLADQLLVRKRYADFQAQYQIDWEKDRVDGAKETITTAGFALVGGPLLGKGFSKLKQVVGPTASTALKPLLEKGQPIVIAAKELAESAILRAKGGVRPSELQHLAERTLPMVSAEPKSGYAHITKDTENFFKFYDTSSLRVTLDNGQTYHIGTQAMDLHGRLIVPLRTDSGKVSFAYLSTSEGDFKWFVGVTDEKGWFIKSIGSKDVADVPFTLDASIKRAVANGEVKVTIDGATKTEPSGFLRELGMEYKGSYRMGSEEGFKAMESRLKDAGGKVENYDPDIGKNLKFDTPPVDAVYNKAQGRVDLHYETPTCDCRVTIDRFGEVDFTLRPPGNPNDVFLGTPVKQRTERGIERTAGYVEVLERVEAAPEVQETIGIMNKIRGEASRKYHEAQARGEYGTHPFDHRPVEEFVKRYSPGGVSESIEILKDNRWVPQPQPVGFIYESSPLYATNTKNSYTKDSIFSRLIKLADFKIFAQGSEGDNQTGYILGRTDYMLLKAKNELQVKLGQSKSITRQDVEQALRGNIRVEPEGFRTKNQVVTITGGSGTAQFELEPGSYFVDATRLGGIDISIPSLITVKSNGTFIVPIGLREGEGKVNKISQRNFNRSSFGTAFAQMENEPRIKLVTFYDKDGDGSWDGNENAVPVAGVTVALKKVNQDKSIILIPGWNLVTLTALPSLPVTASTLVSQVAAQGGYATTVSTLMNGIWKSYVIRGDKEFSGEDFPIEPGKAYFVKALKRSAFLYQGQVIVSSVEINLSGGWNGIGFPKTLKSYKASEILDYLNDKQAEADAISRWNIGVWTTFLKDKQDEYGENFPIENNKGYVLRAKRKVQFSL